MHKYPLDLKAAEQTVKDTLGSGILYTTIEQFPSMRGRCYVTITVVDGNIVSCEVTNGTMQRSDKEAFSYLYRLGTLEWQWKPLAAIVQEATKGKSKPDAILSNVPYRLNVVLQRQQFNSWSHMKRWVFSLIDGKRRIEDIVAIVSKHQPDRVMTIITELRDQGFIAM